ncbi:MAG TPA: cbb3-type cytochrome c oxidase subunit II [Nevskiaceae bacterium]
MKEMIKIFGGAIAIYIGIVLLIAVIPAIDLSQTPAGPGVKPLTPLEAEGREVFAGNGCSYCHSQQVRPLKEDASFGRPSAPGDFAYQTPELLGSERTGPDLTNVGNRQGEVWQYMHLYDPRSVSPKSIMPNFRFLFRVVDDVPEGETAVPLPPAFAPKHGKVIPTHEAKALVAYLMSLKQPAIPGFKMNAGMGGPSSSAPSQPEGAQATESGYTFDAKKGQSLFDSTCAACHQDSGEGIPSAFPPLKGNAAVNGADPTTQIDTILHGRHGTVIDGKKWSGAMPPFGDQFNDVDIANIANYERTSWGNHGKEVTPAEVADIRAGKKLGATTETKAKAAENAAAGAAPSPSLPSKAGSGSYTFDEAKGKALFDGTCAACHQDSGEGVPGAFPPLKGNAAVNDADPKTQIDTILHGRSGTVINGQKYAGAMPPFASQFSDDDIANIANYERSAWGNHGKHVTPEDVKALRNQK